MEWHTLYMQVGNVPYVTKNDLQDEFHYFLTCPYFLTESCNLLKPYFYQRPNILKFKSLLTSTNRKVLANLSKFIKIIYYEQLHIATSILLIKCLSFLIVFLCHCYILPFNVIYCCCCCCVFFFVCVYVNLYPCIVCSYAMHVVWPEFCVYQSLRPAINRNH